MANNFVEMIIVGRQSISDLELIGSLTHLSLLKTMNLQRQIVTERKWFWMVRKSRLIFWIQQAKRIMQLFEIITSVVEKGFS